MRDPQIWALMLTAVGVLGTMMFAMHRLTVREMSARFDAVEGVMNARFVDVDHRLGAIEGDLSIIKATLISQRTA